MLHLWFCLYNEWNLEKLKEFLLPASFYKNKMTSVEHKKTVIHFDIDCFYAQVEMIRDPQLRDKALGIQQKYLLVTCNYEARKRGVTKLMSLVEAKKKCPDLVIVNGEDLTHYRNMSYQISDFIQKYTPVVERLGFDENFADVTEIVEHRIQNGNFEPSFSGKLYEDLDKDEENCPVCSCGCLLRIQVGSQIAADIRKGLQHELGITCCAGIAHNKLLAKLVGSIHKPNQQTSILPHSGCQLVSSLPGVRSIPGIGHTSEKRLKARGIFSVWDLQQAPYSLLEEEFGKVTAGLFSKLCFGIDDSSVVPLSLPQTLSDEDSFKCCNSTQDAKSRIHQLITSLLERLKADKRTPHTLRLTIRRINYMRYSRQCPIPSSVFVGFREADGPEKTISHLMPILMNLFHKLVDVSQHFHLTLINICFAKLNSPNSNQNTIDSFFSGKSSKTNHKCADPSSQNKSRDDKDGSRKTSSLSITEELNEVESQSENEFLKSESEIKQKTEADENENLKLCPSLLSSSPTNNSITPQSLNCYEKTLIPDPEIVPSIVTNTLIPTKVKVNQSFRTLQRLLPKHIDAHEVIHFPDDIQNEVLSEFGISLKILSNGERMYTHINKVSTRSQPHSENSSAKQISQTYVRKPLFSPKKKKTENEDSGIKEDGNIEVTRSSDLFSCDINIKTCDSDVTNMHISSERLEDCRVGKEQSAIPSEMKKMKMSSEDCCENDDDCMLLNETESKNPLNIKDTSVFVNTNNQAYELNTTQFVTSSAHTESFLSGHSVHSQRKELINENVKQPNSSSRESVLTLSPKLAPTGNKRKCPDGVDAEVFFSLPPNIQSEIMAHSAMGTANLFLRNQQQSGHCHHTCDKAKPNNKSAQKDLLKYFKKK